MVHVKNIKTYKGDRKNAVYCGRPSDLSNPFSHLQNSIALYKTATREESIEKFREHFNDKIANDPTHYMTVAFRKLYEQYKRLSQMGEDLYLLCYCHPDSCHADYIAEKLREWHELDCDTPY